MLSLGVKDGGRIYLEDLDGELPPIIVQYNKNKGPGDDRVAIEADQRWNIRREALPSKAPVPSRGPR